MATKRQIQIVENFIKNETKRLMKEASAYERGADYNLKKSLMRSCEFFQAWVKEIDKKQMEQRDFKILIEHCSNLIETLKIHEENWDN